MKNVSKLREVARRIKLDTMTVYLVARDPGTPIIVRLLALVIAAYAISPIDLIPDFIPVVGYLDDVILLPLGILLVIKLTPKDVVEANRAMAREMAAQPTSTVAAAVIIAIWVLCVGAFGCWLFGA